MALYKRGKVWWMRFSHDGRKIRKSCETSSKKLAEEIYSKVKTQITEGKFFEIEARDTTFDELSNDLSIDYKINKRKSIERVNISINHLKKFFAGVKASNINSSCIQSYIMKRLEEGAANSTVNREMAALKRMFNLGVRMTPPKVLSVPYVPHLREDNVRQGYFEHHEYLKLKQFLPNYLQPVIIMAYYTGMRKNEILGLACSQVNLRERSITLKPQDTKNKESRIIFMEGELLNAMLSQMRIRGQRFPECPYVFLGKDGKRIKDFRHAWKAACKKAGLEGRIPHDFRRTAVRNMVRAGVPERVAMMISGHKTRSVFDRYNIVNESDLRLAAKKVENHLGHNLGTIGEISTETALEQEDKPIVYH